MTRLIFVQRVVYHDWVNNCSTQHRFSRFVFIKMGSFFFLQHIRVTDRMHVLQKRMFLFLWSCWILFSFFSWALATHIKWVSPKAWLVCAPTMGEEDVRLDGVLLVRDVRLLLCRLSACINLKLSTLYHTHDTRLGSKSAKLTWAQPWNSHKFYYKYYCLF